MDRIAVARGPDELAMAMAVRAAVFMADDDCPYSEEFDGNDACAMHVLAFSGGEPVGTMRVRFFGSFAKIERIAVLRSRRGTGLAARLVRETLGFVRRKGFRLVIGHMRAHMEGYWRKVTAGLAELSVMGPEGDVTFSGISFKTVVLALPDGDALEVGSPPPVLNRPEGEWDYAGPLG